MKFKIKTKVVQEPHNQQAWQLGMLAQGTLRNVIKYDLYYEGNDTTFSKWIMLATFNSSLEARAFAAIYGKNDSEEVFEV